MYVVLFYFIFYRLTFCHNHNSLVIICLRHSFVVTETNYAQFEAVHSLITIIISCTFPQFSFRFCLLWICCMLRCSFGLPVGYIT